MVNTKVEITFSNGDKLKIGKDSIIFPIRLVEHKGKKYCSKTEPVILEDHYHIHDGYIPKLTTVFAFNDYFTLDSENTFETTVYKTSSIVSMRQTD